MDARFYNSNDLNIERLATDLEHFFRGQGYQVQQIGNNEQIMVQLKKGSDFEALIGLQAALSVIIQRSGGGVLAMIGQQKWMDKAAVGAVGIIAAPVLWPLMITAGAGAIRQASLGNQVLNVVDGLVRQQRPEIQIGPVPMQIMPQIQQQWAPPPPQYLPPPQYDDGDTAGDAGKPTGGAATMKTVRGRYNGKVVVLEEPAPVEGEVAKVYTGVKPAEHSEQVLKDLAELKKS